MKVAKAEGVDPIEARRLEKKKNETVESASTFKAIANEWFGKQQKTWSPTHASRCYRQFERDLFPLIGSLGLEEIKPPKLLEVIRLIEKRGAFETASRALMLCGQPESVTIPPAPSTAPINIPRCLPTAPPIDANDAQSQ